MIAAHLIYHAKHLRRAAAVSVLLILLAFANFPAQAYWTTPSYVGGNTSTDCPTVEVACQKWLAYW